MEKNYKKMGDLIKSLVFVALFCGCLGGSPTIPSNEQALESSLTSLPSIVLSEATTSTTVEDNSQVDFSQVSVSIAGCDDDYYNNSMVAGYVTNNGVKTIDAVPIVTQLLTEAGEIVSGGEKTTMITNLNPGENRQFSVVYEQPPQWAKCRASVNGEWVQQST
ncbi:MAG: FxLYD domain-containing protein [Candidatus Altiarchaeota archaeon]|nr:FxLYD domain-containing protein [Candidatus Altiarchaeota archaeon]